MRQFNLASKAPNPEGVDADDPIEGPEVGPANDGRKARRLLVVVGLVVIIAGGGYIALMQFTQFMAPKPAPVLRPIRPIAKAPASSAGVPAAAAPAPAAQLPARTGAPPQGPVAPAQSVTPPKASSPPAATPATGEAAPASPVKAGSTAPMAKTSESAQGVKPAQAVPPGAAGSFSLQVGAMINEGNAQKLKQRLEGLGYTPVIRKGSLYLRRHVVTTGDFPDRQGAEEAAKRLAGRGIAARIAGLGGRFTLEAGSFTNEDDAIDLARQLQRLNFTPRIQDQAQNATVYQVRLGSFASRTEAQAKGTELEGKGFRYLVVKN